MNITLINSSKLNTTLSCTYLVVIYTLNSPLVILHMPSVSYERLAYPGDAGGVVKSRANTSHDLSYLISCDIVNVKSNVI